MNVTELAIPGLLLIEPRLFPDDRGLFFEIFRDERYAQAGLAGPFVQDNFSRSRRGTLRGLHFQEPHGQGKLVQALRGSVYDVVVDVRRGSPSFGRWVGVELSEDNHRMLWVPGGFAHGFLALSDDVDLTYKCTDFYATRHERTIVWNDPE